MYFSFKKIHAVHINEWLPDYQGRWCLRSAFCGVTSSCDMKANLRHFLTPDSCHSKHHFGWSHIFATFLETRYFYSNNPSYIKPLLFVCFSWFSPPSFVGPPVPGHDSHDFSGGGQRDQRRDGGDNEAGLSDAQTVWGSGWLWRRPKKACFVTRKWAKQGFHHDFWGPKTRVAYSNIQFHQ